MNEQNPQAEGMKTLTIIRDYCQSATRSNEDAQKLFATMYKDVQEKAVVPVLINEILFMVYVRGKGIVEVHALGQEATAAQAANDIKILYDYLKNIGVSFFYAYSENKLVEKALDKANKDGKKVPIKSEGISLNAYMFSINE